MTTTTRSRTDIGWKVDVPEGKSGDVSIEKFEVDGKSFAALHYAFQGRPVPSGTYTRMVRGNTLWMSDTPAEANDHRFADVMIQMAGGRILIGGLGLGMIVRRALSYPNVEHIDVVESDPDVIALVGPTYEGPRCTIHHADMYDIKWPPHTKWSVAWFDIWPTICSDHLPDMTRLARSYGGRTQWQGFWGKEEAQRMLRAEKRSAWRWR